MDAFSGKLAGLILHIFTQSKYQEKTRPKKAGFLFLPVGELPHGPRASIYSNQVNRSDSEALGAEIKNLCLAFCAVLKACSHEREESVAKATKKGAKKRTPDRDSKVADPVEDRESDFQFVDSCTGYVDSLGWPVDRDSGGGPDDRNYNGV